MISSQLQNCTSYRDFQLGFSGFFFRVRLDNLKILNFKM